MKNVWWKDALKKVLEDDAVICLIGPVGSKHYELHSKGIASVVYWSSQDEDAQNQLDNAVSISAGKAGNGETKELRPCENCEALTPKDEQELYPAPGFQSIPDCDEFSIMGSMYICPKCARNFDYGGETGNGETKEPNDQAICVHCDESHHVNDDHQCKEGE